MAHTGDDDGFDIVEAPPVVHSVTANSSGSRIAVAHSNGADVYELFSSTTQPADPHPGTPPMAHLPLLAPRLMLRLDHRHLSPPSYDQSRESSDWVDDVDSSASGPAAAGGGHSPAQPAGVGLVALLYDTNILAVVGGGAAPCQPPNRVLLFNGDLQQQQITLLGPVARVVLQNDRVIAMTQSYLTIHSFDGSKLLEQPALGWSMLSPLGKANLGRLSTAALHSIVAKASGVPSGAAGRPVPDVEGALASKDDEASGGGAAAASAGAQPHGHSGGDVQLRRMPMDVTNVDTNPLVAFPDPVAGTVAFVNWKRATALDHTARIAAHRGEIDMLALTPNGQALVTSSDTNTVVRVWNTTTRKQLYEVRLASTPHTTYLRSLGLYSTLGETLSGTPESFCPDFCLALDSKGELKFFFVNTGAAQEDSSAQLRGEGSAKNQGSFLSSIGRYMPTLSYFQSEWAASSVALAALPTPKVVTKAAAKQSPPESGRGRRSPSDGAAAEPPQHSVLPVDGVAWFELAALVKRYLKTAAASPTPRDPVSAVVVAGNGSVFRVTFNPSDGKSAVQASASFNLGH